MTTLLGIETATAACSVAVWRDGAEVHLFEVVERAHAECLLPMLEKATTQAGVALAGVDAIGVSIGPGAFTSLRIGLAAARGLALALDKPCFGVTSLEAVAAAAGPAARDQGCTCVLAALDSRRRDLFVQPFSLEGRPLATPASVPADVLAIYLNEVGVAPNGPAGIAGDAAVSVAATLRAAGFPFLVLDGCRYPTAASVARLAARRWLAGERPQQPPGPLYLRPADTGPPIVPPRPVQTGGGAAE